MINLQYFSNFKIKQYIYLLLVYNFFSIIFLNDTTSFNTGLISIQSLFFCVSSYLFIFFIIFETICSFLDFYGLSLDFLQVIFTNQKYLNLDFNLYILLTNLKYIFYLAISIFFFIFKNNFYKSIKIKLINLKNLFILFLGFFIFLTIITFFFKNFTPKIYEKITSRFINKIIFVAKGNIFRNDNWYIALNNKLNYSANSYETFNFSFEESFKNYENLGDVYVIINESYPNFKMKKIKDKLTTTLKSNLQNIEINEFKKNWFTGFSTQGAEKELFCDKKGSWFEFKNDLGDFIEDNNCWINLFSQREKIFIHSYNSELFDRSRYGKGKSVFFDKLYFKDDLLNMGYKSCNTNIYYVGICENEIINTLFYNLKESKNKKLVVYLTVENHIPQVIKEHNELICNEYPLNIHPEFCTIYHNQLNFNKNLNTFINNINHDDLLVFFSDTPPLYSRKDRIHFEDYIDIYFFKKIK